MWRNNNTCNLLQKSNNTGKGDEVFRVTFYAVKTNNKVLRQGRSECNSGSWCFLGRWAHWFKKFMAAVKRERCAWVTVQQMCHVVLLVFIWPAFCNDASPRGWSKEILRLQPRPPICKSSSFLHLPGFSIPPLPSLHSHTAYLSITLLWLAPFH